jgi:hypothetical protein
MSETKIGRGPDRIILLAEFGNPDAPNESIILTLEQISKWIDGWCSALSDDALIRGLKRLAAEKVWATLGAIND